MPGGISECMAEDRRFLCSDRGIAARAGRRRELKRCMGTTGVNAKKINTVPKIKERTETKEAWGLL